MTGEEPENGRKTEVIDLIDPNNHCTTIDFPFDLYDANGGLLGTDLPIVCGGDSGGGKSEAQCYVLRSRKFTPLMELKDATKDMGLGSVVVNGSLMIVGGYTTERSTQTLKVSLSGIETLPNLPLAVNGRDFKYMCKMILAF